MIKLKDGEIIPLNYDVVFNAIFSKEENMCLIENLVSACLKMNREEIRGNLIINNRDINKDNKNERHKQVDLLLDYKGEKINIELNNRTSIGGIERNVVYVCNIHGRQLKFKDNNYSKINKTIQININTKHSNNHDLIEKYTLKNDYNDELSEKFEINMIDVEKGCEMCYNGSEEILAKWCYVLVSKSKDELEKYLGDIMENNEKEQMIEEVTKYSDDDDVVALYSAYSREELERNTELIEAKQQAIEEGIKQGIKQGIEQGIETNKKESAINLFCNGVSKEIIMKSLNITSEQLDEYLIEK